MAVALAALLILPAAPAGSQSPGSQGLPGTGLWDALRSGTYGAIEFGSQVVRSVTWWMAGVNSAPEEGHLDDIRGLLNLSEKEFREFDALIRLSGFELQGFSFGIGGPTDMELAFDFERLLTNREKSELRQLVEQSRGVISAMRKSIILALLDASKYVDAAPASGYRLRGVSLRLGTPPEVRIRFQRFKP
jgi:hypothetical protein